MITDRPTIIFASDTMAMAIQSQRQYNHNGRRPSATCSSLVATPTRREEIDMQDEATRTQSIVIVQPLFSKTERRIR